MMQLTKIIKIDSGNKIEIAAFLFTNPWFILEWNVTIVCKFQHDSHWK